MISFSRYIAITSAVGGAASVAFRELILRLFTTAEILATGTIMEFDNADDVADFFGSSSAEYKMAAFYFGWISKRAEAANKISFARWADADTAPQIFGIKATYALSTFTSINNGSLRLTLGATTHDLTGMDFTAAVSLAGVAAVIEAKIQAEAGTMWTAASVSYNATAGRFEFTGGDAGVAVVETGDVGSGTAIRTLIGWGTGAIFSDGAAVQTITDLLADSTDLNNNFGSFAFVDAITLDETEEAATWNNTQNNMFQYHTPVTAANAAAWSAALIGYAGTGMTLDPEVSGEYPELMAPTILAATKYNRRNAVKNYMYQKFPTLTASVDNNTDANTYDGLRINYLGVTQQAGAQVKFFQTGYLCGGDNSAQDMGVYANEQWFKDACAVSIMNLLLALDQVPASTFGAAQVMAILQSNIDQALFNGTIEPGKTLTEVQKLYITNVTGDDTAWHQIISLGYWANATVEPYVEDELTKYKVEYTIVYAKGDSVRKVIGTDIMI